MLLFEKYFFLTESLKIFFILSVILIVNFLKFFIYFIYQKNKISYYTRRRFFLGKQLDRVMKYSWKDAIINFVKFNDAKKFSVEILKLVENYPQPALDCIMNLLDSHDTERVLTLLAFDNPESVPVNERPTDC